MATHSSVLAWRIPGMGEPGGLPAMGLHRVGHDWSDLAAAYKWKNNKVLLYSIGIYNQYHVINHNGTEYKKACIYMYNWGTLLYSRNKYDIVNRLYFNLKILKWQKKESHVTSRQCCSSERIGEQRWSGFLKLLQNFKRMLPVIRMEEETGSWAGTEGKKNRVGG